MPRVYAPAARNGRRRSGAQVDEDRAVLHAGAKAGDAHGGVVDVGPGGHVPAPRVPGARDDRALEVAITEGAAAMTARVVDGVVRAVYVEQGERAAARLHDPTLARGDRARRRHAHPAVAVHGLSRSRLPCPLSSRRRQAVYDDGRPMAWREGLTRTPRRSDATGFQYRARRGAVRGDA